MVQETQMITFKQYLEEKKSNWLIGAALAGSLGLFAKGYSNRVEYEKSQEQQAMTQSEFDAMKSDMGIKEKSPVSDEQSQEATPQQTSTQDNFHQGLQKKFGSEYNVILNAAKRNGIAETDHEKLSTLFAIRKTENGKHGKQFGVLHPRAYAKPGETQEQSLDRQAGWAASILGKRETEWNAMPQNQKNKYQGFHHYLQTRYAPHGAENDPTGLNKNWLRNFTTHYNEHMDFRND
jgi:hypothetical protein